MSRMFLIALVLVLLTACAVVPQPMVVRENSSRAEVRVMTFNIEWGGAKISFDNVVEAIRLSRADIVGIQEAEGNLQRLAGELGWHYDLRNYVVSRYPLIDPPGADGKYVYAEVAPGKVIAIANIHLPSDPYGPDAIRDGATVAEVLQIEQAWRMPAIEAYLAVLPALFAEHIPLFVTGDFNSPAHTDWTDATVGTRKFVSTPVSWPVSKAMYQAGFSDSWREIYPNPVRNPGLTWWAARPPLDEYAPGENDVEDRIDFIWFAGPAEIQHSLIVGETNGPEVSIGLTPWPSDHRAVVSGFSVVPADLPEFLSTNERVYPSEAEIIIRFNTAAATVIHVIDADNIKPVSKYQVKAGGDFLRVSASLVQPGRYEARMRSPTTNKDLVREFWVRAKNAAPVVAVQGASFAVGESIDVSWRNGPGNRNDYLAAYAVGEKTGYDNGLAWAYVAALPEGGTQLNESTSAWGWPLSPGEYVIRLVKDDGYEVLAESAPFDVESRVILPASIQTVTDGRRPIEELFAEYQTLLEKGWQLDIVGISQPAGTQAGLPIIALRSPRHGPATWILSGIHGEEPAGPNAIAATIDEIAALGDKGPVVLLPLLNPHGYIRNWRYLNVPVYSSSIDGASVGDSSHLLLDAGDTGRSRGPESSPEAGAITRYILKTAQDYPPRYSIDLHEDNLLDAGYVYSQGLMGASDPLAAEAVQVLRGNNIEIKMSGKTRFDEDILNGVIGPVVDSSIDELMGSERIIVDGEVGAGPGAATVLVFETPAASLSLSRRVGAHAALIRRLTRLIGDSQSR